MGKEVVRQIDVQTVQRCGAPPGPPCCCSWTVAKENVRETEGTLKTEAWAEVGASLKEHLLILLFTAYCALSNV